jgi:GNAT superfamily N-acetyltransferase
MFGSPDEIETNLRSMHPGAVWTIVVASERHDVGEIQNGHSFCHVMGWTSGRCGARLRFTGPATPGTPTCPGCIEMAMPIPAEVIAAARKESFIHLRGKDRHLRRPILCDGRVVGFCHPHDTPNGYRLGPIFVLPTFRGRGLTRAAYKRHAAGRRCVAYIHDGNVGSAKAHAAAGFVRWRQGRGGWTWVRDAAAGGKAGA